MTFRAAARRKILWIATLGGAVFLALFWAGLHATFKSMSPHMNIINRREAVNMMIMMVLYAGSMMTSLMAALTSCDTLSGEIASGTIHAIATKPVRRWCLVLGKWVGFVGMLTLYVLFVEGGFLGISWFESGFLPLHSVAVLGLIWLQAVLLLGVTIACSTRFSTLTSGAITLGLYGVAFCLRMDRAVWRATSCQDLRRSRHRLQSHYAERCPVAARSFQDSTSVARGSRRYSFQQHACAEPGDGDLRRAVCLVGADRGADSV